MAVTFGEGAFAASACNEGSNQHGSYFWRGRICSFSAPTAVESMGRRMTKSPHLMRVAISMHSADGR